MKKVMMRARVGAWLAVLSIIVLSVVPGDLRPQVLANDHQEHFLAYFISGSLLAVGYPRWIQVLGSGVLLVLCTASLEFVQLWIPGRDASIGDLKASAIGAWIGLLAVVVVSRAGARMFAISYE